MEEHNLTEPMTISAVIKTKKEILNMPSQNSKKDVKKVGIVSFAFECEDNIPNEIIFEAMCLLKNAIVENVDVIPVTDPRMGGKSLDCDLKWAVRVFEKDDPYGPLD